MEHIDTQSIIIIALFAFAFNFLIIYLIIVGATKSTSLLRNSNAQLRVIIEMALAAGVSPEKIQYEMDINQSGILKQARKDSDTDLITHAVHKKLIAEVEGNK
jgi:hypothetical protein